MEAPAQTTRLFNSRPLAGAALGFSAGIVLAKHLAGPGFPIAMGLFLICLFISGYARRQGAYRFCAALLLGMLRFRIGLVPAWPPFLYPLQDALFMLRGRLLEAADALFYGYAPLFRAMLWGGDTALDASLWEAFRAGGLAHVLALSGLHVSFFTGLLLFCIPACHPRLRFFTCAAFLALYCGIAAFPASLVRASVMTLCTLGAGLFHRRTDLPSSLALAALLLLMANPAHLFDVGFQLSFAAVAGIAMLHPPLMEALSRLPRVLAESLSITASGTLSTLPLSLHYFKTLPSYSLIVNFLLLPLVPFCIIPAFFATLLYFVSPLLARIPAFIAYHMAHVLASLAEFAASLPYSILELAHAPGWPFVALAFLCMLALSPYPLIDARKKRAWTAIFFFLLCFSFFYGILGT